MTIDADIAGLVAPMTEWRRDFHAHPETAYREERTAARVAELLQSFGCRVAKGLGGTGVVGTLKGGDAKRRLMFRADMDALPMTEAKSDLPHRSKNEGAMHGCGHDGHMAMLLGAAAALAKRRSLKPTIHFLFQPAEENEAGAKRLLEEGLFEAFPCDAIFGLHNWPGLGAGEMAVRAGPVMASCDLLEVTLTGRGTHAAMPHLGRDVLLAGAHIVTGLQSLVARETDPQDCAVVSLTQFQAGETWNVLPERAVLRGTVRALKPETRERLERRVREVVEGVARAQGVAASIFYDRRYPPTVNDPAMTRLAEEAALRVVGEERLHRQAPPSMGSEDFAFLLREKPGAYAWLGGSKGPDAPGLHNPSFDFNDEVLAVGASWWTALADIA